MNSPDVFITDFKKVLVVISAAFLLFSGLPTPGNAYNLADTVKEFSLENGLKVVMVERHTGPTVALYISHPTGAIDDTTGSTGTAHFLEHLRFKGTETIGTRNFTLEKQILSEIFAVGSALDREKMKGDGADKEKILNLRERLKHLQKEARAFSIPGELDRLYTENGGGALNAFTGQDLTTYHVTLPANRIELWARIEADRLANPVFREFYSERDVIMEERSQRVASDPDGKLREQFMATAFVAHPYRRPILGWKSDMRFLDIDCISTFFNNYYTPGNTIITIVGDISPNKTMAIIERYFGSLKDHPVLPRYVTQEPAQEGERRVEVTFDAAPRVIIGYHKPTLPSFDDCIFDVMDTILSDGRTSRLYKALVKEKAVATSVRTANGYPGACYPNLFVIFAEPMTPHTTHELEEAIYEELDRFKREPLGSEELEKAKNKLKADLVRRMSTNAGLAGMLSYYETVAGNWRYILTFLDLLEKVTPEDIMTAARQYLVRQNRTVATLVENE